MSYQPPTSYYPQNYEQQSENAQPYRNSAAQQPYVSLYAQPTYPAPEAYPMYGMPVATPERGRMAALTGLVLGAVSLVLSLAIFTGSVPLILISWFAGIPISITGIVFSALGCRSTTRKGMAITGLVLATIALVLAVLILIIGLAYNAAHHA